MWVAGLLLMSASLSGLAQEKALVNTSKSPFAKLMPVNVDAVKWTGGFWGHWFDRKQGYHGHEHVEFVRE